MRPAARPATDDPRGRVTGTQPRNRQEREVTTMPTFHNPVRVDVIEGGSGFPWGLAAGLLAAAAVAMFVLAHLVVIAIGAVVAMAVTAGSVRFLHRFVIVGRPQTRRPALPAVVTVHAV